MARVGAIAALLVPIGSTTACSTECNKRLYDDIVQIELPPNVPTDSTRICVDESCQSADPLNGVHAVRVIVPGRLKSGSVSIRFETQGTSPLEAVLSTKPTTDTHGGCATQRLVSLRYDAATGHLVPGPDIPLNYR